MSAPPWIKPGNLRVGWQSGKIGAISGPDVSGPNHPRQVHPRHPEFPLHRPAGRPVAGLSRGQGQAARRRSPTDESIAKIRIAYKEVILRGHHDG